MEQNAFPMSLHGAGRLIYSFQWTILNRQPCLTSSTLDVDAPGGARGRKEGAWPRHLLHGAGSLEGLSSVLIHCQPLHEQRKLLPLNGPVLIRVVFCTQTRTCSTERLKANTPKRNQMDGISRSFSVPLAPENLPSCMLSK